MRAGFYYEEAHSEKEEFQDKCGIIGVHNSVDAAKETFLGLHALQHRGQEASGLAALYNNRFKIKKYHGTVASNFSEADIANLSPETEDQPFSAIGHVRYATCGVKNESGIQPFFKEEENIGIALAHNGNLVNYEELRAKVEDAGISPTTNIDSELILHLIFISRKETLKERIIEAVSQLRGAFSLVILTPEFLFGCRDRFAIRPLSLGKLPTGEIVIASETCAFDIISAQFIRDLEKGEMIFVSGKGKLESVFPLLNEKKRFCIFEYVYFARPDSFLEGRSVYNTRKEIGKVLAQEAPAEGDIIVAVPDSGVPAALGFAEQSGIPFEIGIVRSHYIGRTFIDPTQKVRANRVTMKHNPNRTVIEGKRIILIDDSIVRGTTSKKILDLLFKFGAKEIHFRISSPPTKFPCYYGIDTPDAKDLIAHSRNIEEIRRFVGATTLSYISLDGLKLAIRRQKPEKTFCDACFTGDYFA